MSRRRWYLRLIIRLAAAGLLGLVMLSLALWIRHGRPVTLPAPTGPFAVGRIDYRWVDVARHETLGPDKATQRELMTSVWYPATPVSGTTAAPYLPQRWWSARERAYGLEIFLTQDLSVVHDHAVADAPLASARPTYPVVLLLLGLGPIVADYTTLAEDLASHGYIVAGLTPTYSANLVVFPDGREAQATAAGNPPDGPPEETRRALDRLIATWAADASFGLDKLTALNLDDATGRFTGRLDLGAAGIIGHSFGGATAAAACATDPRFRVGIDLDGYPYGTAAQSGLAQPFLFLWSEPPDTGDGDWQRALREATAITATRPDSDRQLTITGTRHFNFSDYALLYTPVVRRTGGLGSIDGHRGLAITATYVEAFLGRYLAGDPTALFDGPAPDYPEVRFGDGTPQR